MASIAPFDVVGELSHDGHLSESLRRRIKAVLVGRARVARLSPGETADVRVRITAPRRSTRANNLYWACLTQLASHLLLGGMEGVTPEGLHIDIKGAILPLVAAEMLDETGEIVEYKLEEVGALSGRRSIRLTTTELSVPAFSRLIGHVDRIAAEYGLDLGHLLDDESVAAYRSGRIEERQGLGEVLYAQEADGYVVLEDDPSQHSAAAWLGGLA